MKNVFMNTQETLRFASLRRHYPDQVQRVCSRMNGGTLSICSPAVFSSDDNYRKAGRDCQEDIPISLQYASGMLY